MKGRTQGEIVKFRTYRTQSRILRASGNGSITAAGWPASLLTSCVGARPEGGAGCVSAHVRICAGPPGKPAGYRDGAFHRNKHKMGFYAARRTATGCNTSWICRCLRPFIGCVGAFVHHHGREGRIGISVRDLGDVHGYCDY